jgi:hypothetical protein
MPYLRNSRRHSSSARLDDGRCLVVGGPGTTQRPREENLIGAATAASEDPRLKEALQMTIVWILIVIILVLLVIALARRVL